MSATRKPRSKAEGRGVGRDGHTRSATRCWYGAAALFLAGTVAAGLYFAIGTRGDLGIDHTDKAQVERGRRVYQSECASCHGANLEGQPNWQRRQANERLPAPPHDASGHTWHHADQVLIDITKRGPAAYPTGYRTDMPAFGGKLGDEDIAAILAFIKSTWPAEIRLRQPQAKN